MSLLDAPTENDALEVLHELGCTDGLPVVIPTSERVSRMVLATGFDPELVLGVMGPMHGSATGEKVCISAVMAGCIPDHVPVVVAAIRAICQPEFDLTEMQATTHCTAPLMIVCGPARHVCGEIASGFGALGPGHRANASIGRALRLAMINIGGARPGSSDMALHGHPGKFSYCVAEDEENGPFPGLHTTFGYDPEQSAVVITGAEAPHSTFFTGDRDDPNSVESLLNVIALVMANPGSNNVHLREGAITVMMNPDHADVISRAGLTRQDVQAELARRATISVGTMRRINPAISMQGIHPEYAGRYSEAADDDLIHVLKDPSRILVFQAGGSGLYTMVMPSWCAGPHRNAIVHAEIELDQTCEIPGMSESPN